MKNSNHRSLINRYLFLCIGLMIMAFGVAFSIKAGLGTSPISSVPYVINCFTPFSVGNITIMMHCIFILLQIIILRKNYELVQLMQLPVAIIFGFMTDFAIYVIEDFACNSYTMQWIYCLIGIFLVAIGVSCEVVANVVTLAGEGLILALCKVLPIKFGYMKVLFDLLLVCIALVLCIVFLQNIVGVREGTVAAAILVGLISKQLNKLFEQATARFFD